MADRPPRLPIDRSTASWRPVRIAIVVVAQALALLLMAWLVDGIELRGFWTGLLVVAVIALVGALVWPTLIRLSMPLVTATLALFTLVLNAAIVALAAWLVDGFEISSIWWGIVLVFVLSLVDMVVSSLLNIDDEHLYQQRVIRRIVKRKEPAEATDVPGFVFIQIDGLGYDILRDAIESGHVPTIARLVSGGTHRVLPWECDLSSQTGAMQAGILLGDNHDMPAFRWYEKDTRRILVSNRPRDAADLEARRSTGAGLLADGGASRTNVFSGDAPDTLLTFSRVLENPLRRPSLVYALSTPYSLIRIVLLFVADLVREKRDAWRAKRAGTQPSMHRGGVYPLLRAATTVVLPEITSAVLIADIVRGVPASYIDDVAYDEVAHHSGLAAPESLDQLRRTDERIRRILTALDTAPRPYYVVILSDHGQTQGSTFEQRYGHTLDEAVRSYAEGVKVEAPVLAEEGWNNLNGMLTDAATEDSRLGRAVARATRSKTSDGEVAYGPSTETAVDDVDEIVVLASGNLGLLSFTEIAGRATRQEVDALYPGLIDALAGHDGIGFVMVRDAESGDVVLGGDGVRYLDDDRIEGVDPLAHFGPNAADHIRRTSSFSNCPDLLVNSFYDPVADEGAAFEGLIGFHGGMGGKQCHPFVLAPTGLSPPDGDLVGARSIHELLSSWMREAREGHTTADVREVSEP